VNCLSYGSKIIDPRTPDSSFPLSPGTHTTCFDSTSDAVIFGLDDWARRVGRQIIVNRFGYCGILSDVINLVSAAETVRRTCGCDGNTWIRCEN